jgi:catechol 2,3-dioxygenase-like lactoylglutathione lyase family enzyme
LPVRRYLNEDIMRLDHVVIVVKDLEQAVHDYQELGFTVTAGGEHADGRTHNALIAFADGTYLELIAFKEGVEADDHPWWRFVGTGGGYADWALLCDDVAAEVQDLQQRGLPHTATRDGGRLRPDGVQLEWRGTTPAPERGLPFLIEDLSPRDLRVPSGAAASHRNGALGIQCVMIAVDDLARSANQYGSLFGMTIPAPEPDPLLAAETVRYSLGSASVVLAAARSGPIRERVERAGVGPYAVMIATDGERIGWLSAEACPGAALRLQPAS